MAFVVGGVTAGGHLERGGPGMADIESVAIIRAGAERRRAAVEDRVGPEIGRRNSRDKQGGEHRAERPRGSREQGAARPRENLTKEKPFSLGGLKVGFGPLSGWPAGEARRGEVHGRDYATRGLRGNRSEPETFPNDAGNHDLELRRNRDVVHNGSLIDP